MSNRTERRAAERAARKAERTAQPTPLPVTGAPKSLTAAVSALLPDLPKHPKYNPIYVFRDDPPSEEIAKAETSPARIAANRINALKATGPRTPEGCAKLSLNALKHGLTGNTVLLDADDAELYQQRLDAYVEQHTPVGLEERRLVQSLHDAGWRLDRILNLESTIYAKGRIEMQDFYEELPENQRKSFVRLETYNRNEKQFRNLYLQEGRIQRQRAKDLAALKLLIDRRKAEEQAADQAKPALPAAVGFSPVGFSPVGFEFSNPKIALPTGENTPAEALDGTA
jgi:hypothetical protein